MRLVVTTTVLTLAACGPSAPSSDAGTTPCSLSSVAFEARAPDGTYRAPPSDAELVLGFQGFRYVYVTVQTDGLPSTTFSSVRVELADGAVVSQAFRIDLSERSPGRYATDPLLVFFNDTPLPSLIGRSATVAVEVGTGSCVERASGAITFVFDPSCYEGPSGERICVDGGLAP